MKTCSTECGTARQRRYRARWHQENRERLQGRQRISQKRYNARHRDRIRERRKRYHEANRDRILARKRAYRAANKEALSEAQRAYREANRETIRERARARYWANVEAERQRGRRQQRARKHYNACYEAAAGRCRLCGTEIEYGDGHIDHKVPRSKGGSDDRANLQLACEPCNQRKNDRIGYYRAGERQARLL
ncbi:MAG: HNH endonuclease signature motif containing protein [Acidobacteria bacterium]|nr:HNH endonuclease signature motif containing protein [Acidobacteriota bacterium]